MLETAIRRVDFYPRPPRGGRPYNGSIFTKSFEISIHALREEGDGYGFDALLVFCLFLSTPSARRATGKQWTMLAP